MQESQQAGNAKPRLKFRTSVKIFRSLVLLIFVNVILGYKTRQPSVTSCESRVKIIVGRFTIHDSRSRFTITIHDLVFHLKLNRYTKSVS